MNGNPAIVVFGGEAGALMTIARDKTNWAAHLYVYLPLATYAARGPLGGPFCQQRRRL